LCLGVLLILTIVNMRGVHDTGVVFMIPTYIFTATLLIVIGVAMDTLSQIEAHMLSRHYEGFLKSGRIKGRR